MRKMANVKVVEEPPPMAVVGRRSSSSRKEECVGGKNFKVSFLLLLFFSLLFRENGRSVRERDVAEMKWLVVRRTEQVGVVGDFALDIN